MLYKEKSLEEFTRGSFEDRCQSIKKIIEKSGDLRSEIGCTKLVACFDDHAIVCNDVGKIYRCNLELKNSKLMIESVEQVGAVEIYSPNYVNVFLEAKARETVSKILDRHSIGADIKILMRPEIDDSRIEAIIKQLQSIVDSNNLWGKSLHENEGDVVRSLWSEEKNIRSRNSKTKKVGLVFIRAKKMLARIENLNPLIEHTEAIRSMAKDCKEIGFWLSKLIKEKSTTEKHGDILLCLIECLNNMDLFTTFLSGFDEGGENKHAALS